LDRRRDARTVPASAYPIMNRSGPHWTEMSNTSLVRAASAHAPANAAMLTAPVDQATAVRKR